MLKKLYGYSGAKEEEFDSLVERLRNVEEKMTMHVAYIKGMYQNKQNILVTLARIEEKLDTFNALATKKNEEEVK